MKITQDEYLIIKKALRFGMIDEINEVDSMSLEVDGRTYNLFVNLNGNKTLLSTTKSIEIEQLKSIEKEYYKSLTGINDILTYVKRLIEDLEVI